MKDYIRAVGLTEVWTVLMTKNVFGFQIVWFQTKFIIYIDCFLDIQTING